MEPSKHCQSGLTRREFFIALCAQQIVRRTVTVAVVVVAGLILYGVLRVLAGVSWSDAFELLLVALLLDVYVSIQIAIAGLAQNLADGRAPGKAAFVTGSLSVVFLAAYLVLRHQQDYGLLCGLIGLAAFEGATVLAVILFRSREGQNPTRRTAGIMATADAVAWACPALWKVQQGMSGFSVLFFIMGLLANGAVGYFLALMGAESVVNFRKGLYGEPYNGTQRSLQDQ